MLSDFQRDEYRNYKKMLDAIAAMEKRGMGRKEAEMEAFYQVTQR